MRSLLTIAGSDSGGGAGIQADLRAFWDHGWHGTSVITAVTAQHTAGVTHIEPVSPEAVRAQLEAVLGDMDIAAIKIGMVGSAPTLEVLENLLQHVDIPIILDPVMVATAGQRLLKDDALSGLRELHHHVTVTCPNGRELAQLADSAHALATAYDVAVVVTGGDAPTDAVVDTVVLPTGESTRLVGPRIPGAPFHGTGCTFSSALAALIASEPDRPLVSVVESASAYVRARMRNAWTVGAGSRVLGTAP